MSEEVKEPQAGSTAAQGGRHARPSGKRQRSGTATVSRGSALDRVAEKSAAPQDNRSSRGNGVLSFPGEVKDEVAKVVWPTGRQMVNYTLVVFAFLIFMTVLVAGTDYLAGSAVEFILVPN